MRAKVGEIQKRGYALLIVHPVDADESLEFIRADTVLRAVAGAGSEHLVIIYPNNDPGQRASSAAGKSEGPGRAPFCAGICRGRFSGACRISALVGNSSAGIIEAASFGTPVVDVGPRQKGASAKRRRHSCRVSSEPDRPGPGANPPPRAPAAWREAAIATAATAPARESPTPWHR